MDIAYVKILALPRPLLLGPQHHHMGTEGTRRHCRRCRQRKGLSVAVLPGRQEEGPLHPSSPSPPSPSPPSAAGRDKLVIS